jgi:sugar lactone lactonase YvrE
MPVVGCFARDVHGTLRALRVSCLFMLLLAGGCATPAPRLPPREPVLYPPPPAAPRLQFLTSISDEKDLGRPVSPWIRFLFGSPPPREALQKPYGLALKADRLFVCDTVARCISVFDLARKELTHWQPRGDGRLQTPINLAVDDDGTIYVADTGRERVLIFDGARRYVGALAEEDGMKPTDVVLSRGRVYVADLQARRVWVYDKATRERLFGLPRDPADSAAELFSPVNLAVDGRGDVFVSDLGAFRVQRYDAEGRFVRSYGAPGDAPGRFARPKGLAVDRTGLLYVADAAIQAVQIFDPQGELLLFFGAERGPGGALNLPADVVIDYEHVQEFSSYVSPGFQVEYLVLVSSQYGDRKVNVYGFGHSL